MEGCRDWRGSQPIYLYRSRCCGNADKQKNLINNFLRPSLSLALRLSLSLSLSFALPLLACSMRVTHVKYAPALVVCLTRAVTEGQLLISQASARQQ